MYIDTAKEIQGDFYSPLKVLLPIYIGWPHLSAEFYTLLQESK